MTSPRARQAAKNVLDVPFVLAIVSGLRDLVAYYRFDGTPIRVRALNGHAVHLRPGTSDRKVLRETLGGREHAPPGERPQLIWDLGANIGITVAHMAELHPKARVLGVELAPENAALARTNIAPWSPRAEIIQVAVWHEDGVVRLDDTGGAAGKRVGDVGAPVEALSLNTLLARTGPPDYVKMDIEGAERAVLTRKTAWAHHVKAINVEVHGDYTVEQCRRDLERLGFVTEAGAQPRWPPSRGRPFVNAWRR